MSEVKMPNDFSTWYRNLTPEQQFYWTYGLARGVERMARDKEDMIGEQLIKEQNNGKEQSTAETQADEERLREEGSRLSRE